MPSSAASSSSARSICLRGSPRFAPRPTKLLVIGLILPAGGHADSYRVRLVRRLTLIGAVALCCCAPAQAAVLAHPGKPLLPGSRSLQGLQAYPRTLVELDRDRAVQAAPALRRAGGVLIAAPLALWRVPSWSAAALVSRLERRGLVRSITPDVPLGTDPRTASGFFSQFTDPLSSSEWWPSHVGVQSWVGPGPGKPLTMIDSGVDLGHEEFLGRPNTIALNRQSFSGEEEEHGTMTASVAAAPVNGKGIVGIYPQAKLQLWDASPNGVLTVGDEIAGLSAARRSGAGVINLSRGGRVDGTAQADEHAALRGDAPLGAGRRLPRVGPGHRLRDPRRSARARSGRPGSRPTGAERGRLPRAAERAYAHGSAGADEAATAAGSDPRGPRAAGGSRGRLPHLPAGEGADGRDRSPEREREPRAVGEADDDRFRAGCRGQARPPRRLGAPGKAVRACHAARARDAAVRLRRRVPAKDRRAGLLHAQRRPRRALTRSTVAAA